MDKENPTLRERLAIVETELKHNKESINGLAGEVRDLRESTEIQYNTLTEGMASINSVIDSKLRGSLSGAERASIIVAVIMSIGAIIVALIK